MARLIFFSQFHAVYKYLQDHFYFERRSLFQGKFLFGKLSVHTTLPITAMSDKLPYSVAVNLLSQLLFIVVTMKLM